MFLTRFLALVAFTIGLVQANFTYTMIPPWVDDYKHEPKWARDYLIDLNAAGTYLTYASANRGIVVCFNIVRNGDIYMHMSGPITSSWLGFGFGEQMENSLMLVSYPASNMANITTAVRIGSGHTEPAYAPEFEINQIFHEPYAPAGNTVTPSGSINVHVHCKNCTKWPGGEIDIHSTRFPMFWAMGPNKTFSSDDPNANIDYHVFHGRFYADITQAMNYTGDYGRVPAPNTPQWTYPPSNAAFASSGVEIIDVVEQSWSTPEIHGILMCLAFLIIFPLGALLKLLLRRIFWHAAVQSLGVLLVLIGFGLSIKMSAMFIRSKDFNSGHQILGLIVVAGLIVQFGLGLMQHAIFVRTKSASPIGRIHMFLGPTIMILGIINGGLGLRFGGEWIYGIAYSVVVAIVATVFLMLLGCVFLFRTRQKQYKAELDYEGPTFGNVPSASAPWHSGYHNMDLQATPPGFGAEPPTPYEPATPFPDMNGLPYEPPAAYEHVQPYHPTDAYMPDTPKTWKKVEVTEYAVRGD